MFDKNILEKTVCGVSYKINLSGIRHDRAKLFAVIAKTHPSKWRFYGFCECIHPNPTASFRKLLTETLAGEALTKLGFGVIASHRISHNRQTHEDKRNYSLAVPPKDDEDHQVGDQYGKGELTGAIQDYKNEKGQRSPEAKRFENSPDGKSRPGKHESQAAKKKHPATIDRV